MSKKRQSLTIISWLITAVIIVVFLVVLRPYYREKSVYTSIDEGNWKEAQKNYDKLNDSQKQDVQDNLDDYGAFLCEKYMDGKTEYDETSKSFDALGAIDESSQVKSKYMNLVRDMELEKSMDELVDAMARFDSKSVYEIKAKIYSLQNTMDNQAKENALIRILNTKYDMFLDEKITSESMQTYISMITDMSYYDAYYYSHVVFHNVNVVIQYRDIYSQLCQHYEKQEYVEVMYGCDQVSIDPNDERYRELFAELRDKAYQDGLTYYQGLLDEYISGDRRSAAVELISQIEDYYSDELNIDNVVAGLASDWQKAYIGFMDNWEEQLKKDASGITDGGYITGEGYEELRPDSLLLKDINGDMVPELFLFNSAKVENTYVGCFIYGYVGGQCKLIGFVNVRNFGDGSYLIGSPNAFGRAEGDEYVLIEYDGETFEQLSYCQEFPDRYVVDDNEVSDLDYLTGRKNILDHAGQGTIRTSDYSDIEDADKYILSK